MKHHILRTYLALRWQGVWRDRPQLEAWQRRQLRALQAFLGQHSPYYRQLLAQGYDIDSFPVITKTEFMAHFNQINSAGLDREEALALAWRSEQEQDISPTLHGYAVGLSTGTSGNRGLFVVSERERAEWVAMVLHRVLRPRLFERQRIAFILRANNPLYESVQSRLFQFRYYQLPDSLVEFVAELHDYQPQVLAGQPSVLRQLAEAQLTGRLHLRLRQVISYAEVLEPDDRARIEQAFGLMVSEVYQCTEGFLGATCAHGTLHLNEDVVRIERAYMDQQRFQPIVTDLRRRSQPVVRYRLNDLLVEADQPCPCGSVRLPLARIEGRMDEVLRLRGKQGQWRAVYPDWIRRSIVASQSGVQEYRVCQTGPQQLTVSLDCPSDQFFVLSQQVKAALQARFDQNALAPVDLILEQGVPLQAGIKRRRIVRTWTGGGEAE